MDLSDRSLGSLPAVACLGRNRVEGKCSRCPCIVKGMLGSRRAGSGLDEASWLPLLQQNLRRTSSDSALERTVWR